MYTESPWQTVLVILRTCSAAAAFHVFLGHVSSLVPAVRITLLWLCSSGSFFRHLIRNSQQQQQNTAEQSAIYSEYHYHLSSQTTSAGLPTNNKMNANIMVTASGATMMACRLCRFPGSDLRLVGCGCTIHAVSSEKEIRCNASW
jgi:hypothetical protein